MAPDGTALPVVINVHGTQRYADGTEQQEFSARDVDPLDPAYLWVAGAYSTLNSTLNFLYRVRISDGQVEHTCQVSPMDEPAAVSGGNLLLAAANFGGRTVLFARPGSPGFRFALQVIDAETCNGIDVADFFYPQYSGEILLGIEVNGSELLGAVLRPDGSVGVYNFGSRPYLFKTFADATLLFSLPNLVGDLALGSSF